MNNVNQIELVGAEDIAEDIVGSIISIKQPRKGLFKKSPIYVVNKKSSGSKSKLLAAGLTAMLLTGFMAGPVIADDSGTVQLTGEEQENKESPFNFNANMDFLSKFVSKGHSFSEGQVIQPNLGLNYKDFTLSLFGNFDTGEIALNELDLTLDWTKSLNKNFTIFAGYNLLTFPNTGSNLSQEVYTGVTLEKLLRPTLSVVHDFDEVKGTYGQFSISHDFSLKKLNIPYDLSAEAILGFNSDYIDENNGLHHVEIKLSSEIPLIQKVVFTPMISYSRLFDYGKNELVFGLGIGSTF